MGGGATKLVNKTIDQSLEQERLKTLINNMSDGVVTMDDELNVIHYNGFALNILNLNYDITGKDLSQLMRLINKDLKSVTLEDIAMKTVSTTISRDYRLVYEEGDTANLYISLTRVTNGNGTVGEENDAQGFTLIFHDITKEKSLEEEREEFISVISHELRTPIAIAEGDISNSQLLYERGGDPNMIKSALEEAHKQVMFLGGLVNDLSTLSRAERDKVEFTPTDVDFIKLLNELQHAYSSEAETKGLKLQLSLPKTLPTIKSSELYVREVLQNFITNAIKYTDTGQVAVSASPSDDYKSIIVDITDTGIGISTSDQAKVWEKFYRSENYKTREHSGTGLGLYVVTKLVKIIHADIKLTSALGKGSTFTVTFANLD
jgi:two-component system, OmpR family, phosphate regulon sensor histidine kinase PhoR